MHSAVWCYEHGRAGSRTESEAHCCSREPEQEKKSEACLMLLRSLSVGKKGNLGSSLMTDALSGRSTALTATKLQG
eukprot:IDg13379t1